MTDSNHNLNVAKGLRLEYTTLAWNVVGVVVVLVAAWRSRSVALAGFGLDSVIEILASTVVVWQLLESSLDRQRRALRLMSFAFGAVSIYVGLISVVALATHHVAHHSVAGILWTALTALVMFFLAAAKTRVGRLLNNPVLQAEGRVTFIDGVLATSVMIGLGVNAYWGWWWADPLAGLLLVYYVSRECVVTWRDSASHV